MTDLISRQAAIDAIHEDADWLAAQGSDWQVERMERDKSILKSLPSAQPEIIRCGDCKYFKVEYAWNCASYPVCEVSPQRIITPDDYCSFAERRTDEQKD